MTREDAIDIIKSECYVFNPLNFDRSTIVNTALDMAIKALEQEPCEDCISRQAAIDELELQAKEMVQWSRRYMEQTKGVLTAKNIIKDLPPVTPQPITLEKAIDYLHEIGWMQEHDKEMAQPRWISVSERLPEEYGEYMITWTTSNSVVRDGGFLGTAEYDLTGEYDHENNRFKGEWLLEDYVKNYEDVKVIAWMPLPEPYREEMET